MSQLKCPHCPKLISKENLTRHVRQIHGISPGPKQRKGTQFHCNTCKKWFAFGKRRPHYRKYHNNQVPQGITLRNPGEDAGVSADEDTEMGTEADTGMTTEEDTTDVEMDLGDNTKQKVSDVNPDTTTINTTDEAKEKINVTRCEIYAADVVQAVQKLEAKIAEVVEEAKSTTAEGAMLRTEHDHLVFDEDLQRRVAGHPLTKQEFMLLLEVKGVECVEQDPYWRYAYVVCDTADAHEILAHSSPRTVIVIRDSQPPRHTITNMQYMSYLRHKEHVEVHDHMLVYSAEGDHNVPQMIDSKTMVKQILDEEPVIYNALNLAGYKQNSMPECFEGLANYNILHLTYENDGSGKRTQRVVNDLTAMTEFTLFATAGAISLAHHDSQGTITSLHVEEGEKLCLLWPAIDHESKTVWQDGDSYSPSEEPFAVYLKSGDTLILPAGRVHSVYTMATTLVTGGRFWDSREMLHVVRAMKFERRYPQVTNEGEAKESMKKLRTVEQIWKKGSDHWEFGSDQELKEFSRILQHLSKRRAA